MKIFPIILANSSSISRRKKVCNIGINDADYIVKPVVNKIRYYCPFYLRWHKMITRCYGDHTFSSTYEACTVCEEWLIFSNFKVWMEKQDWKEKELDKDILVPNNKEYSPTSCCFIERKYNALLAKENSKTGKYAVGVYKSTKNIPFVASCFNNGKAVYLGNFKTEIEASNAYLTYKIQYIKDSIQNLPNFIQQGFNKHIYLMEQQYA